MEKVIPRGLRNNNPCNIRSGARWLGLSPGQIDKTFCQFLSMDYGFRAVFVLIRNYRIKYHVDCLSSIINRWAPESDGNNPKEYIRVVLAYMKQHSCEVGKDSSFVNLPTYAKIRFVLGMAKVENGIDCSHLYSDAYSGYRLSHSNSK